MKMPMIVLVLGLAAGCGSPEGKAAASASETPAPPKSSTATAATTSSAAAPTTAAPQVSPEKEAKGTVIDFLKALQGRVKELGVTEPKTFDADTDPNKLLGRPGQYLEKVSWKVAGQDATIEVYPTVEGAKARAEYVRGIGEKSPVLLQYVYVNEKRKAVVRLPHQLSPKDAKVWEELVAGL